MNPLESRRQQLIVESEINRAQLVGDIAGLKAGVQTLADRAKSFSSIASSTAALVAGLAAFRRGKSGIPDVKSPWWQTILQSAGMVATLWLGFFANSHDRTKRDSTLGG